MGEIRTSNSMRGRRTCDRATRLCPTLPQPLVMIRNFDPAVRGSKNRIRDCRFHICTES
jgi:hypothetical protein